MQSSQSSLTSSVPGAVDASGSGGGYNLFEVWGDTVDARHLGLSIGIGAAISLGLYALAEFSLRRLMDNAQMAHAYAMLGGIVGCLLGGIVSALLFKPKRVVQEEVADEAFRATVLADLTKQYGDLGRLEDVAPEVLAEMKELGLYDMFLQAQQQLPEQASAPAGLRPVLAGNGG
ncbi:hypothetical protein [Herbaspirillum sp. alder98]|uniref:hypothetical protein n=1 Tax=Herbaspirillum sp. alder98 TaxID=2913096 RepID=UPI001CD8B8ED|nr:hypothetical protein [Herbaspirillum sp. alder98]MCA1322854.1 hypothetical protein [Herbaspirillum sp. alder98]